MSLSNAGARYTESRSRIEELNQLDWSAIAATDFRSPDVKERTQAELLLHARFPLALVERIGAMSANIHAIAAAALAGGHHRPVKTLQIVPGAVASAQTALEAHPLLGTLREGC